jgi:hypothetical protein
MITLFACPKPFQGHIDLIQRNALKSWTLLSPRPEIMLMGAEKGVAEICQEFNLIHVPDVEQTEYGTPLVSSVFQLGQSRASAPVVCYINSDIMLMDDFTRAIETVAAKMPRFLALCQRTDIDIREAWNFASADWEADLKNLLAQKGSLHAPTGIDFFCFPKGMYADIPPLVIGRPGFDNWLVWRARTLGFPIVDVTEAVTIAHQNHPSTYVKQTLSSQEFDTLGSKDDESWIKSEGKWVELIPDAKTNIRLVPDEKNLNIWAATWQVDRNGRLKRRRWLLKPAYLYYQLRYVAPIYFPGFGRLLRWSVSAVKGWLHPSDQKKDSGAANGH